MDGPRQTAELPARIDELHLLKDIGVVTAVRLGRGRFSYEWTLVPGALDRIAKCLTQDAASS